MELILVLLKLLKGKTVFLFNWLNWLTWYVAALGKSRQTTQLRTDPRRISSRSSFLEEPRAPLGGCSNFLNLFDSGSSLLSFKLKELSGVSGGAGISAVTFKFNSEEEVELVDGNWGNSNWGTLATSAIFFWKIFSFILGSRKKSFFAFYSQIVYGEWALA